MRFITAHMDNISRSEFAENELLQDSMMFRMIQISENARKLSDSFRQRFDNIP